MKPLLLLSTLLMSSFLSLGHAEENVTFEKTRAVELKDDFSNIEDVRAKLSSFKIKVKLKDALSEDARFACYKIIGGDDVVETRILAGSTTKVLEVKVNDDEIDTEVNCRVKYQGEEIAEATFDLTKSLLLDSETKLNSLTVLKNKDGYSIDRLILLRSGSLITNGESFTMNVEKFYSQDSVIQTFTAKDILGQRGNVSGKSGGVIQILAKTATGKLQVNMYGQNGDDQTLVPEQITSVPGQAAAAAAQTYRRECDDPFLSIPIAIMSKPIEINCPPGGGCSRTPRCYNVEDNPGHPASTGYKGFKGITGYVGNLGGGSGTFNITTTAADANLELSYDIKPGAGGAGGIGGLGGAGGAGGAGAGKYGAAGAGPQGDRGDQGPRGNAGDVLNSCITDLTKNVKKCNQ